MSVVIGAVRQEVSEEPKDKKKAEKPKKDK